MSGGLAGVTHCTPGQRAAAFGPHLLWPEHLRSDENTFYQTPLFKVAFPGALGWKWDGPTTLNKIFELLGPLSCFYCLLLALFQFHGQHHDRYWKLKH